MIAGIALRVFGWAAPGWAKPLLDIAGAALVIGGAWWWFAGHYEQKGATKVEQRVEREHADRMVEARTDERAIAATGVKIAERAARIDRASTDYVRTRIEEINDALQPAAPNPDPAADAAVFDSSAVRSSVNSVVDRANRAADAADAAE